MLLAAAGSADDLELMVSRRLDGQPLEHIVGWAEFCGLRIIVEPGVFVPRRRTELLARTAVDRLAGAGRTAVVVDLCCGSGAVAAAVANQLPGIDVHAADVDPTAVACARRNLGPLGGSVHLGDLYAALPADLRGRISVITANAPYVPSDSVRLMPPEARVYEPAIALDGGADGLDVQRRVIADAPSWLRSGGTLLIETSATQSATTAGECSAVGLAASVIEDADLEGCVVVAVAQEGR